MLFRSNTGVPLAFPSHCFTLRPSIREFHQHALLVAFILRPSIREFHQHALLTASPCGLQYESSISTPFSLPYLAAFNTGVPSARPSHCFTLWPLIREFHQHALLTASPCGLQYKSSISTPFSLPYLLQLLIREFH